MTAATATPRGARRVARRTAATLALIALWGCAIGTRPGGRAGDPDAKEWVQLFNGRDLAGWDVKFAGHPLGVNLHETFRVTDGLLEVRYDRWPTFAGEFGHLFHRTPYSHYVIAVEYRFVGEQARGAAARYGWAVRNNGIMLHAQSARSMGLHQDFPVSLEVQLLGGLGDGRRRGTANLCTPGTHVVIGDSLVTAHCIDSRSPTHDGDRWVRVEALVLGDSVIKHIVAGDTVLVYARPRTGGGNVSGHDAALVRDGRPLREGYVALQAESAPTQFRKVELLNLVGCMDPAAVNFRRHHVRSDPASCRYAHGTRDR